MRQEDTTMTGRKANRKLRLAGYGRVSRVADRGDKLRSPELQTNAMQGFATSEGAILDEVVVELDVSGSKTTESAELERLVQRVERGELDGIVVPKLDRLSRLKARQRVELVERIGDHRLFSATESNDVSTPEGRFVRELFWSIARLEWEQKADGFAKAKANAIAAGVSVAKRPAFGLAFDADHRYIRGPEAELVVELFELRAGGASFATVAEHVERRTGRVMAPQTIAELLSNRLYLGELRHGELLNVNGAPKVVPVELFETVQAVNAERSVEHSWSGRRSTLLAGIARCASCGAGLTRNISNGGASVTYRCPTSSRKCAARASIGLAELEAHVLERVLEWAGPVADELVEVELELGATGERVVAEHRLAEARVALLRWAENVEAELEDQEAYDRGLKAREKLVARRELELEELGEATEVELARSTVRTALAEDGELDVDERRQLLSVVLERVVVRRTPRAGAPVAERAELIFATPTSSSLEDAAELDGEAMTESAARA